MDFKTALEKKIEDSQYHNFGKENFDEIRFGKFRQNWKEKTKNRLKQLIRYKSKQKARTEILKNQEKLEYIWNNFNKDSQSLMIDLLAYRLLSYTKVKLPLNNSTYWDALKQVQLLKKGDEVIDPKFLHFILQLFDLRPIGYNVELFFFDLGIAIDFIFEQYAYKLKDKYIVQAEPGDVVLDIGACWGDTSLYFSEKVGPAGHVYSFEFIPENIDIFRKNISLNPNLENRIQLIEKPVSDVTGQKIYYETNGPGSRISFFPFDKQTGCTETISVDDFVENNEIDRIDFIKMDIEGAEPAALQGALKTIVKHRPKLAIAIYHSMDDFANIPKWLMDLDIGYEFYLGHYTIHYEETIIFGCPAK